MERLVLKTDQYSIFSISEDSLFSLIEFVVKENYKHHIGHFSTIELKREIQAIYQEEIKFHKTSIAYIVRNNCGAIIGSIRVFKWDRILELPIQKIFGINPLFTISSSKDTTYWHIGRFAIDSFAGISTLNLFKQLMVCAIEPILRCPNSYMIAETDSRLLKVMNALGIKTCQLGTPINYLASETIPIYSDNHGLEGFYNKYSSLMRSSHQVMTKEGVPI